MLTSVTNSIRRVPTSTLAAIAFFAVALFISTFFVGDIGVYNDDHFCNQRDPVTHEPHDFVMNRPWHLWRPLTRVVLIPLVTALWPWPWALHAISAVLHGVVVWLLYALLRRFGIRATLAAPVALAFMLYPVHFEAVLWIDIICTLMSVVVVLGIWNTYLWWIAASHERSGNLRFVLLVLLGAAAWCAAAMNEQPPGALAALPLAVLVSGLAVAPTLRGRLSRSAMPIAAVGIGLLIYLQGYFKHTGRASQADVETAVVESLPQNLADLASKIPRELYLKNVAMGALTQGAGVVAAHPFRAALLFGLLGFCVFQWMTRRPRSRAMDAASPPMFALLWLIPLGLAWFVASWLPVAAAHSTTSPRLHYVPLMGLALIAAAVLSMAAIGLGRVWSSFQTTVAAMCRCVLFAATTAALLMWIGIQINYQRRFEADQQEIEPLTRLLGPTVPAGTFFIPVRVRSAVSKTSSPRYDAYFAHCWTWEFAAGWNLQYALRRNDVYTVCSYMGVGPDGLFMDEVDPIGSVMMKVHIAHPVPADLRGILPRIAGLRTFRRVALDRCVFFDIPRLGETEIYTKIRVYPTDSDPITIDSRPLIGTAAVAALPEKILELRPMSSERREAELAKMNSRKIPLSGSSPGASSARPPR